MADRIPANYSSIDNNQKLIGEENNRNNAKAKAIDDRLCNMFDIEGRFKKIFPLRPKRRKAKGGEYRASVDKKRAVAKMGHGIRDKARRS